MPRDRNTERDMLAHVRLQEPFPLLPPLQSHHVTSAASLTEKGLTSAHSKYGAMEVGYGPRELRLHMVAAAGEACLHGPRAHARSINL